MANKEAMLGRLMSILISLPEEMLGTLIDLARKLSGKNGKKTHENLKKFLRGNVEITVVKHTVDLGASPSLPFNGAEVVKHEGEGVVDIELRSDDNLYIDGKKVDLFLSERQKGNNRIVGNELRQELESGEQVLLNGNVLDYIYDNPELFPEHWKKDENGEIRYIFFWGSIFRNPPSGRLYVQYLSWGDGGLSQFYHWLGIGRSRQDPSASVAS